MRLTKLVEAYEDEADPESVDFFRNPDQDPLSDHPVVKPHGHELATGAFNFTKDRLTAKGGNVNQMMQIFQRITQIEGRHRAALQDMAKRITAKVWGISTDNMDAELGNPEPNDTADHDFGGEGSVMDDRIKSHVHMRATMNMLTHGAAVHHMMTIHHMVREELDRIDPALLDLYDKLAAGSVHQYWLVNIRQMCEMLANMAVGSARVEFPETDYEEDDEEAEPKLVARAICFPVLCQELSKAVMMLLSNHHLSKLSHGDSVTVLKNADAIHLEPWYIMVGPEIWRRFAKTVSQVKGVTVAEAVAAFANMEPETAHKVIITCVKDPQGASRLLQAAIDKFLNGD